MKPTLQTIGLNSANSVVIGSGILQALDIRKSNDIDLVVTQDIFDSLKKDPRFKKSMVRGKETLKYDLFEIGTYWKVLGRTYYYEDFRNDSVVIDNVRYITLDLLLKAKKSWLRSGYARPKDIQDIKLMEAYNK